MSINGYYISPMIIFMLIVLFIFFSYLAVLLYSEGYGHKKVKMGRIFDDDDDDEVEYEDDE